MTRELPTAALLWVMTLAPAAAWAASGDSKIQGEFKATGSPAFASFQVSKPKGKDAQLQLISGEKTCRFLLDSFLEEESQGRRTVRFQGSKVECDLKGASTVIGVIEFVKDRQSGRIQLVGDGKSADLIIDRAASE